MPWTDPFTGKQIIDAKFSDPSAPPRHPRLRAVLWPQVLKPEPGFMVRLGRLLHWIVVAGAAVLAIGALGTIVANAGWMMTEYDAAMFYLDRAARFAAGAVATAAVGRAVRYLLAGE